jgi:hypothetical protein
MLARVLSLRGHSKGHGAGMARMLRGKHRYLGMIYWLLIITRRLSLHGGDFHWVPWPPCLGEVTIPDKIGIRDYRKVTSRLSVELLPAHKADTYFEGNQILIQSTTSPPDPVPVFSQYLHSRDRLFPWHQHLWLTSSGDVPHRAWFMRRLRQFFPSSIAGHSMRAGGATAGWSTPSPHQSGPNNCK